MNYNKIKNFGKKTLLVGGLALILGGCYNIDEEKRDKIQTLMKQAREEIEEKRGESKKNYFTNWGFLRELNLQHGSYSGGGYDDLEIRLGDMDCDGDLDIVVGSRATGLRIYENRIPQKNKK